MLLSRYTENCTFSFFRVWLVSVNNYGHWAMGQKGQKLLPIQGNEEP